ncbi:MAG: tetratricopeptide repeat protein [Methanothrix sp.]|nr:tetratricopeptide repeat protein [Methanothrix sp.]
MALKNLDAIFGKEGDSLRALYYLRRSFEIDPLDPQTVYGLAFAYMELGDMEPAQKHFQAILGMEAPEELRVLAIDAQTLPEGRQWAPWREGGKTRNVHLGSSRMMDTAEARQKARETKAEALGRHETGY